LTLIPGQRRIAATRGDLYGRQEGGEETGQAFADRNGEEIDGGTSCRDKGPDDSHGSGPFDCDPCDGEPFAGIPRQRHWFDRNPRDQARTQGARSSAPRCVGAGIARENRPRLDADSEQPRGRTDQRR
jgi:hypothetical protein